MNRLLFIIAIAVVLFASGCGSGDQQAGKTGVTLTPATPTPAVEQPKPSPTEPVKPQAAPTAPPTPTIPASNKRKPASVHRARSVAQALAQVAPAAVEDGRSVKLANEILDLPLQDRLEWSRQEFAKRGINVRDDR
ncbi:hypothetical protein [Paludibaculum fermentans]|uniref:Uncharacterized protein n=1 Tax=Paludibaculum fermentans TaxID=1473598 RepID=A0A7S7SKW9_PALFE|nr:hypothetical protein [Paludibaculum fermentans]QOY88163.1 hypothetical protein IRI77_36415 [Paludibaculum fermentans]